ncbi:nephrin-like [Schistocerca nitens]|uniref:nephrin-like n=1 Tax=Schistocerca nitens TaxID=7011 RepID=UPI0021184E50|nr:nephrin-like [Schistocerca nitens]
MGSSVGALLALCCVLCAAECSAQLVGNYPIVEAVLGGTARLPCDISPPADNDSFTLVIWFKEEATPIYSYDVRGKLQLPSLHWQERRVLGDRASFDAPSPVATPWASGVAALTIRDVQRRDDALYRCRVDFRRSPSRNFRVQLAIIVPPDVPRIVTDEGEEVTSVAGPYFEGATIALTCVVSGGRPMPTVRWWRGERLLAVSEPPVPEEPPEGQEDVGAVDPLEELLEEEEEEEEELEPMRSRVQLGPLARDDLGARLTCQASNTRAAPPVAATVALDLVLAPLEARVLSSDQELSAGRRCSFTCQATGSRPPAIVTWWLDGHLQPNVSVSQQVSEDGNVTTSTVTLTPSAADHKRVLTCRAENPRMNAAVQEDLWRLNVNFPPSVELQLGTKLNADDIKEGEDVYFECNIEANPNIYKLVWKLNGQVLVDGTRTSVRVINHSLVLRNVDRRRDAGNYTCVASNVEGDGVSNTFHLRIKFRPVCAPEQPATLAVPAHDVARVLCRVEAHPPPLFFRWFFNSSAPADGAADAIAPSVSVVGGGAVSTSESGEFPQLPAVPEERYRMRGASGTTSLLTYTPITGSDYGDLLCFAVNAVGSQGEPCVFTVLPASKPDPPSNCTLMNQTSTSLQLECLEGFDGGQPQTFELLVEDAVSGRRLANLSSRWPAFGVAGLPAGQELRLTVVAVNSRGRSAPVALDTFTLKAAELRTGRRSSLELTPVLAALLALVLVLLLLAVLSAACAVYLRVQRSRDRAAARPKDLAVKDKRLLDKDDKNPDVVPSASVDGQTASVAETPVQALPQPQTSPPPQEPPPLPPPNPVSPQAVRNGDLFLKYNNDTRSRACAWDSPVPPGRTVRPASADVTYAELSLPRSVSGGGPDAAAGGSGSAPRSRRRDPPTVYAQIDHSQRAAATSMPTSTPPPPPPPPPREIVTVRTPLVVSPQESCV